MNLENCILVLFFSSITLGILGLGRRFGGYLPDLLGYLNETD